MEGMVELLAHGVADLSAAPLDFSRLPAFDAAVYEALRRVPAGETVTYGELAERVGRPGAARAVGRAMGDNPWPILVPCHRVVGADGKAGGFSAPGGTRHQGAHLDHRARAAQPRAPAVWQSAGRRASAGEAASLRRHESKSDRQRCGPVAPRASDGELHALRQRQGRAEVHRVGGAAHVGAPAVGAGFAAAAGLLLAAEGAADLGAGGADVDVGDAAVGAGDRRRTARPRACRW